MLSFVAQIRDAEAQIAAPAGDPWLLPLGRLRGKIDFDGLERVTSQKILDLLEIPQRSRRAPVYRRVAKLMAELGWTAVRVRDLTGRGCKEQVRGYCRQPLHHGGAAFQRHTDHTLSRKASAPPRGGI